MVNESKQIKIGIHSDGNIDIYVLDKNYPYVRMNGEKYFECRRGGDHIKGQEIQQPTCDRSVLSFKHLKSIKVIKILKHYLENYYCNVKH